MSSVTFPCRRGPGLRPALRPQLSSAETTGHPALGSWVGRGRRADCREWEVGEGDGGRRQLFHESGLDGEEGIRLAAARSFRVKAGFFWFFFFFFFEILGKI